MPPLFDQQNLLTKLGLKRVRDTSHCHQMELLFYSARLTEFNWRENMEPSRIDCVLCCFVLFSVEENYVGVLLFRTQWMEGMEKGQKEKNMLVNFITSVTFFLVFLLRFRLNKASSCETVPIESYPNIVWTHAAYRSHFLLQCVSQGSLRGRCYANT